MRRIQTFKVNRREGATPTNSNRRRLFVIGVEKDTVLPSLRTVRAVLPHTALQSVVSTSGLARSQGCCHGEQSQVCEVHIWPASLLNHLCPLTPLPSAANIRSVQIARSTHAHSVGAVSVCLAFSGVTHRDKKDFTTQANRGFMNSWRNLDPTTLRIVYPVLHPSNFSRLNLDRPKTSVCARARYRNSGLARHFSAID